MSLQSITQVNVDFYKNKYITINAKQNDKNTRYIEVTCYNNGTLFPIDSNKHSAYIRYKKADGYGVLDECSVENEKILVELTEQMLTVSGICYADLIIVKGGSKRFDTDTGEMIGIDGSSILSTMTFCINVVETPIESSEIESSYDFNILNEKLDELESDCEDVILIAKSWAEGGTGVRAEENENNAKYWAEIALKNAFGEELADSIVLGVKGEKESNYRIGRVNITAENIGAVSSSNVAAVNEVKNYLGI